MIQGGTWSPYTGSSAIILAVVLFIITGVLAYVGTRIHEPVGVKRPGWAAGILIVGIWCVSLVTIAINVGAYAQAWTVQYSQQYGGSLKAATNPISPITDLSVLITFIVIIFIAQAHGLKLAFGSAVIGALAAPWIFELPFDLIIMSRLYYVPKPAVLYTLVYFLPLFLVELSTFALLTFSPLLHISKYTLFALAGMFLVFAIWAAFGFAEPAHPLFIVFNGVSKLLSFVAAITLFYPPEGLPQPAAADEGVQTI